MKLISPYYKAVVAAVSLIGTMLVTASTNPDITSVLPVTAAGWLATAGTVVRGVGSVGRKVGEVGQKTGGMLRRRRDADDDATPELDAAPDELP